MGKKIYGIFVAGGSGTRMGGTTPKQFLLLNGVPVLQRTMEVFKEAIPDMVLITVLPKAHFQLWKDLCLEYSFDCPHILAAGGITRFHSVKNALEHVPDGAVVMIHDGVRPLVSGALVKKMASMMDDCQALIPVIPVVDTLRSKTAGEPAPDRSAIVAVQTPQVFQSECIKDAYDQAFDTSFTDDASVAERKNIPISMTDGEKFNLKITTPDDLLMAEAILQLRQA